MMVTPQHQGQREPHPLAQTGVFKVEDRLVAKTGAIGAVGVEQEWSTNGASQRSHAECGNAHAVGEQHSAEDDAEVIDQRRDGLQGELFAHQHDGGEHSTSKEEELGRQDDACDAGAEQAFGRVGIEVDAGEERGEDLGQQDSDAEHQHHGVEDDGKRAFAFGLVVVSAIAVEDGDEGDGGCAADEEVADPLGQIEGDVVGVRAVACAELVGDVLVAHQADDAREQSRQRKQDRR